MTAASLFPHDHVGRPTSVTGAHATGSPLPPAAAMLRGCGFVGCTDDDPHVHSWLQVDGGAPVPYQPAPAPYPSGHIEGCANRLPSGPGGLPLDVFIPAGSPMPDEYGPLRRLAEERKKADTYKAIDDRRDQAILAFGAGTAGRHVSREALAEFRRRIDPGLWRNFDANPSETYGELRLRLKWNHVLELYTIVGELAAEGHATVKASHVTYAWNRTMHEEHADGGKTDFCSEDPAGF